MIILNKSHPLTNGLIFDTQFIEKGGSTASNIVRNDKGAITGATWAKGPYGWYLSFDGTGDSLFYNDKVYFGNLPYLTVEIFMNVQGGGGGNYGSFFSLADNTAEDDWFGLQFDSYSAGWGMRINTHYDDRERVWSIPFPTLNVWDHYVFIYNHTNYANTPVVYKNGVPITVTDRFSGAWVNPLTVDSFALGRNYYTGGDQTGNVRIGYARLWNRMLTTHEAKDLYSNPWRIYRKWPTFMYKGKVTAGPPAEITAGQWRMMMGIGS